MIDQKSERYLLIVLILVTLGLRLWQLDLVPPGWRDDELINSLVISQHTLNGDIRPYYADASGHEGLYHILNAGFLALFGPTPPGIRYLSVILGLVTVISTYWLTLELFGKKHKTSAFIVAFALSFSFWSLMYSRTGIRHIALPALVLPSFIFFWRWLNQSPTKFEINRPLLLATLCLGAAYYTYFASRGVPLILLTFLIFIALIDWQFVRRNWSNLIFFLGVSTLLTIPLYLSIQSQAGADARVAELAVPLIALGEGDVAPLFEHIRITLGMFHATGDGEFLYNIPDRPLFGPIGAILFWIGLIICVWQTVAALWLRFLSQDGTSQADKYPYTFLLLWWGAGISPAFISVPPASLSHTILAQSAVYIIAVVPLIFILNSFKLNRTAHWSLVGAFILLLILPIAVRDLPDYFVTWPNRGQTRFLYRADIRELAEAVVDDQLTEFAVGGPLAGPWDRVAFEAHIGNSNPDIQPRWYNPERVAFLSPRVSIFGRPKTLNPWHADTFDLMGGGVGEYKPYRATLLPLPEEGEVCFENNLCLIPSLKQLENADQWELTLQVFVRSTKLLPIAPLISNPPPPDVYAGPRLAVFAQLLDQDGAFITGDDGFWVDPETLGAGDIFWQRHMLMLPTNRDNLPAQIAFGLYDPMTGERIRAIDGREAIILPLD